MSAFPNYEFQNQQGAEDNGANNPAQVPQQQQAPPMAQPSDSGPASFQGGGADPGSAGGPSAGGDAKTTLWSVSSYFPSFLAGGSFDGGRAFRSWHSKGDRWNVTDKTAELSLGVRMLTNRFL